MLMFRFWSSDSRGSDRSAQADQHMFEFSKAIPAHAHDSTSAITATTATARPPKRRRPSNDTATKAHQTTLVSPAAKRSRVDDDALMLKILAGGPGVNDNDGASTVSHESAPLERAQEAIHYQFGLEILLKHDELRLINQELAKCQIALEQLRRCHLIPYPVNCPTPEQMLNISSGAGPALKTSFGEKIPEWAPPFGVTDGPYARHYAKWLIPDPKFDGIIPDTQAHSDALRPRNSLEGRTTRNSITEPSFLPGKGRARGPGGQKLQALSSGYPQPKDKAGPCVLKRSDGQTVKLVCIDCHRENFSSTQGFINHCRIAHRRDFKSHEEAAVHSGHPIEVNETTPTLGEEKAPVNVAPPPSGLAHPFARETALSQSEACFSVVARIEESIRLYKQGKLPSVTSVPSLQRNTPQSKAAAKPASNFVSSSATPHLSGLLKKRKFDGNLDDIVQDAKQKIDLDEISSLEEDLEEPVQEPNVATTQPIPRAQVMRVPTHATVSPAPFAPSAARNGTKGPSPHLTKVTPIPPPTIPRIPALPVAPKKELPPVEEDDDPDEMDSELSPHTVDSNRAPSLVSDDGEYDDSVDGSSDESEANDSLDAESISDVAEIDIEDDHMARSLRHHRGSTGAGPTAVRLRKDDNKHVTFVGSVTETSAKDRRGRKLKTTEQNSS